VLRSILYIDLLVCVVADARPSAQRSILEADQEEESEESGDMNDDEINLIISRTDEEIEIYGRMDVERERDYAAQWKVRPCPRRRACTCGRRRRPVLTPARRPPAIAASRRRR
jgi:hypothetical protein